MFEVVVVAQSALLAQDSANAEQVGSGVSDAVNGLAGILEDLTGSSDWGSIIGWIIVIAVGLWVLRLIGLRRG